MPSIVVFQIEFFSLLKNFNSQSKTTLHFSEMSAPGFSGLDTKFFLPFSEDSDLTGLLSADSTDFH